MFPLSVAGREHWFGKRQFHRAGNAFKASSARDGRLTEGKAQNLCLGVLNSSLAMAIFYKSLCGRFIVEIINCFIGHNPAPCDT